MMHTNKPWLSPPPLDRAVAVGGVVFLGGVGGDLDQPAPQMVPVAVEICETFGVPVYNGTVVGAWLVAIADEGLPMREHCEVGVRMLICPHCGQSFVVIPTPEHPDLSDADHGYAGRNVMHGLEPRRDLLGREIREHWMGVCARCWNGVEIINGEIAQSLIVPGPEADHA